MRAIGERPILGILSSTVLVIGALAIVSISTGYTLPDAQAGITFSVCHVGNNGESKTIKNLSAKNFNRHLDKHPLDKPGDCPAIVATGITIGGTLTCGESNPNAIGIVFLAQDNGESIVTIEQLADCSGNETVVFTVPITLSSPVCFDQLGILIGANNGDVSKDSFELLEPLVLPLSTPTVNAELDDSVNLPGKGITEIDISAIVDTDAFATCP